jgi:hypothetical protein
MTETSPVTVEMPNDRPPDWANALMRWAVTTPGIQRMVGAGVALLTFEGRRTGQRYAIPVSYDRDGDTVTLVTKRQRNWWHNFETPHDVELRLAGETFPGTAIVDDDPGRVLDYMVEFLERRPIDAKAYGLAKEERTRGEIARIVPHIVVIRIEIAPAD